MYKMIAALLLVVVTVGCNTAQMKKIGKLEALDSSFFELVDRDAQAEIIGEGYDWSEGPLWVESEKMLLFSDIPPNKIYKWTEAKGVELYLTPSGYTSDVKRGGEVGSNGLLLNKDGKLVMCQHGDRRMAMMDAPLNAPAPKFVTLGGAWQGKKFNSPNDAVFRSNGDLFVTDPPYGLEKNMDDPLKEIPFQGVYKITPAGEVTLLTDTVTRPNGIAFLPGEKTLIVASSDPKFAVWWLFDLGPGDSLVNKRLLYDATAEGKKERGLPDGLKIDKKGNIFATGPGGVWVFNPQGKVIGKFKFDNSTSNIALADDDKTMYITNDMYVLRVKLRK